MRNRDMLLMSLSSLFKRKVRTILTVLGVVIGTASIVVMISLGLGLKRASLKEIEQFGGLTTITVSERESVEQDPDDEDSGVRKKAEEHLSDKTLDMLKAIEHVEYVYPELDADVMILSGGFQCYTTLKGIPASQMEHLGIELSEGSLPMPEDNELKVVFGNAILGDFFNEKTGEGYWYNGQAPDIDLMKDGLVYIFDVDKYMSFKWGDTDENGQAAPMPKKYMLPTAGVMAGGLEDYSSNAYSLYCDLELLKKVLMREYKGRAIPGQPVSASGKPLKEIYYTQIVVGVDEMDRVKDVQTAVKDLGYTAESNAEWVESMQSQFKYIQLALGGIGAVSLFVAAIGIANTMMMSIYERTKEIGIMKVLGCDISNIQAMFLMEAGFIGLIGGVVGSVFSAGVSFAINRLLSMADMGIDISGGTDISYIPPWLMLLAVAFAVVVGMAAGFFPSLRAMKLSPLAAIRND